MTEPESASAVETQTAQNSDKWIIIEGLTQTRKNFGIVVFAALLHFVTTTLSEMFQIEGLSLQQLYSGSGARYILLEVLVSVVGVIAIVPVLMASHVSLIKGISGWAAITSRTLKEWDRFVGAIIFWVVITSLMFALPFTFLPELSLFSAKNESTTFDAQSFDIVKLVSAISFVVFPIFSILIATWMPAAIYNDKVSLRRVVARGKKTFWYVFSRLIILILFTLIVSAVALVVLTPVLQAVLPRVENPTLIVFIVNSGGTALVTSCLVPIFSVICVRAYNLGEARLNDTFGDSESVEAAGSGAA